MNKPFTLICFAKVSAKIVQVFVSGLCLAFKNIFDIFKFSWPSDILNIQNHSNLSYFEAILLLKTVFADNLTKCISVQSSAEESFKIALTFRIIALYFLDKINYSWPQWLDVDIGMLLNFELVSFGQNKPVLCWHSCWQVLNKTMYRMDSQWCRSIMIQHPVPKICPHCTALYHLNSN